ncbi:MAG: hypothetical protein ABFS56_13640 [Pseudomonadota bacterium]
MQIRIWNIPSKADELEIWVWSDSPHVAEILGWKNKQPDLNRIHDKVRAGKNLNLPVIAYYSSNRLWINGKETS